MLFIFILPFLAAFPPAFALSAGTAGTVGTVAAATAGFPPFFYQKISKTKVSDESSEIFLANNIEKAKEDLEEENHSKDFSR